MLAVLGCFPVVSPSLLIPEVEKSGKEIGFYHTIHEDHGDLHDKHLPTIGILAEKQRPPDRKEIRLYYRIYEHHGDLCDKHLATIEILAEELRPPDRVVLNWTFDQRHAYFVSERGMKENWPYEEREADIHVLVHDGDDFIVKLRYIKSYAVKWIDNELLYVSNWPGRIYQVVQVIDVSRPEVVFSKCRQYLHPNPPMERPPSGH